MKTKKDVSGVIVDIRKSRALTRAEIAKRADISAAEYASLEKDPSRAPLASLKKVLAAARADEKQLANFFSAVIRLRSKRSAVDSRNETSSPVLPLKGGTTYKKSRKKRGSHAGT